MNILDILSRQEAFCIKTFSGAVIGIIFILYKWNMKFDVCTMPAFESTLF